MHQRKKNDGFIIDKILSPLAVIAPLFVIPQVYEVWVNHRVVGVSALSWFLMGCMALLWLLHAIKHKDALLMINSGLMVVFNFSIWIGVVLYSR